MAELLYSHGTRKQKDLIVDTIWDNFGFEVAKLLKECIDTYNPAEQNLIQKINHLMKVRFSRAIRAGNSNYEYEIEGVPKKLRRLKAVNKALAELSQDQSIEISLDRFSNADKEKIMNALSLSENEFQFLLKSKSIHGRTSVAYDSENDEEASYSDFIIDEKTSGAYDYMVACSDLSDMFSYIFLRVKEKKHAVLKMIDTNIISKTINRISEFSQYTDPVYKQYSDQYKNYMDLDIILFYYFEGQRDPDPKQLSNKKSLFSKTYRSEFDKYAMEWRKASEQ